MALPDGKSLRVLVVDDEKNIRTTLAVCLEGIGCRVSCVGTASAALSILAKEPFDLAFVDLRLDKESGMDLIPELLSLSPGLPIVIITAYATVDTAVEAIRRGARDYLAKPFSPPQVRHIVEQTLERRALGSRVADLEHRLAEEAPAVDLTSDSPAIRAIVDSRQISSSVLQVPSSSASSGCFLLAAQKKRQESAHLR